MAKATSGPVGTPHRRTYRAEGGTLNRGRAVIYGTADDQASEAGANAEAFGIVEETTALAGLTPVIAHGEAIAIAGAQVTKGQYLKVTTDGKLIASAGEDVANVGRAVSSAAALDDEFVMFVNPVKKRS